MNSAIFSHRSIRKYKSDPIPEDLLKDILEAGSRASTTGNMQVYSIIVTKDEDLKKQLWECHFKQNMVLEAPVVLTFCADYNRFSRWCRLRKAEPGYNNFLSFFTAAIDALLAAQNVCIEAEENGLGICYLGTTTYMANKIIDVLKLPQLVVPVTTVVLGYPDEQPGLTDRLPMEGIIHQNTYKDYNSEDIDMIYSLKESMGIYQQFVDEHRLESLAQVFTEKRYTKKDNEFFSEEFLKAIRRQGFLQ